MHSRIRPLIILCLLLSCVQVACAETISGKVVSVADGDTITVLADKTEIKVRLHGIDTPERGQDFGSAAKEFTSGQCFGEQVTVEVTDTDRYGRKVGIVKLEDGRILNHELVAAGLAHWYKQYAPEDTTLERLQAEAKTAGRGLWSRPDVITPQEFRRGKRGGKAQAPPPETTDETTPRPTPEFDRSGIVYLTETGSRYHREGCHTLKGGKKAVARTQAEKQGLGPCGICKP